MKFDSLDSGEDGGRNGDSLVDISQRFVEQDNSSMERLPLTECSTQKNATCIMDCMKTTLKDNDGAES